VADAPRGHVVTAAWPTFSLLVFASEPAAFQRGKFDLFRGSTRFAARHGFEAVRIPERHFTLRGIFPNPALAGVVRAETTERIPIRAGSVVMPPHSR
jgi:alkanesulfonate monooxygenase SsuD/methylene tetrahydromethanopterin reductase-like flavin-dependent oxidoreductase (luciferase family)